MCLSVCVCGGGGCTCVNMRLIIRATPVTRAGVYDIKGTG